ncbi:MAG: hypothetical protein ACREV5_13185 [Steroidobacter sp.]
MNKFVLLLFTISIALGAVTLHLVRELRAERENSRILQARISALPAKTVTTPFGPISSEAPAAEAEVSQPVSRRIESSAAPATAAPSPAAIVSAAPAGMPSREERIRMMRENAERQRALLRDPDYRDAMLSQHKMMLSNEYSDLAAELQLAPEDADRLVTLLAEQQLRSMENQDAMFFDGPTDPAAVQRMQSKARVQQQKNEAEIAAVLGDEKTRAWKEYQSSMGVRHQVTQLRNSFASKGAPLQPDQVKPLQRALADSQERMMQEWSRNPPLAFSAMTTNASNRPDPALQIELQEEQLRRQSEHNARVRETVAAILTSQQLKFFEEEQDAQLKIRQAHLKMQRARAEAEARGEISPGSNGMFFGEGVAISSHDP